MSNNTVVSNINISDILDKLREHMTKSLAEDLKYQTKYLGSDCYNNNLEYIYDHINLLYEKTRYLYDLYDYTEMYIRNITNDYYEELDNILKSIQNERDTLKNSTYTVYQVDFKKQYNNNIIDRDNATVLSPSRLSNGKIIMSSKRSVKILIKNITVERSYQDYKISDPNNLLHNKSYAAYYFLNDKAENGITEKFIISFDQPYDINYIDLASINCNILTITYVLENGSREVLTDVDLESNINNITQNRKVTSIEITIKSDICKILTFKVAKSRLYNFMSSINDVIYDYMTGNNINISIDELAGLNTIKAQYEEYLRRFNEWLIEREKIAQQNRQNGYDDTYLSTPESLTGVLGEIISGYPINIMSSVYGNPYPASETYWRYCSVKRNT